MSQEEAWVGDLLEREREGKYLKTFLKNRYDFNKENSFVLNINAEWGYGKTYFLKNLAKEFKNDNHPVVFFDAWKNDFTKNPLLAFMAEMNSSLEQYFNVSSTAKSMFSKASTTLKALAVPVVSKFLTGMAADKLEVLLDAEVESHENTGIKDDEASDLEKEVSSVITKAAQKALVEHNAVKKSIETFKKEMTALIKYIDKNLSSKKLPMLVFIDELDRCRPDYAIELLENIKHIFDIQGIVFVIATDSQQLSHSINAVYGNDFASERYLKRFFHQEYNLAKPNSYLYSKFLLETRNIVSHQKYFSPLEQQLYTDSDIVIELFNRYCDFFQLGFRDREQVAIMLESIVLGWTYQEKIQLPYLLFLIILKQLSSELFKELNSLSKSQKKDFMTKNILTKLKVDYTISFPDYYDKESRGLENRPYSVLQFFHFYNDMLDITFEKFQSKIQRRLSQNIEQKILQSLRKEVNGYPDVNYIMTQHLNKYPALVLQAGQFS